MNILRRAVVVAFLLAAVLLGATIGGSQEADADKRATLKRIAGYATLIDRTETEIARKQWEYRIQLSLVLTVGILGAASAAIQKFDSTKARVCTLVMGVIISAVTFAANSLFPADHRALKRSIDRARHERDMGKVEADSVDLSASGEVLLQLERQVQARYAAIIGALAPDPRTASLAPATAWAAAPGGSASRECQGWSSGGALCFSGVGRSTYPEQARQSALQIAIDQASQYVARQAGGARPPEAYREYVERFVRVEEVYPSKELRTGREFVYVAILTLNPRFTEPPALGASSMEPRTIAGGDYVLLRGWRTPAGAAPAAGNDIWLRIDGQEVRADRGAEAASSWVFGKRGGVRGPLQSGDTVSLRGLWGDPYVTAEVDGRLLAFHGPTDATLFRLDKRGGSQSQLIREGDPFALVVVSSGRVVRIDGGRAVAGPPGDSPSARLAAVLVPRIGATAKY